MSSPVDFPENQVFWYLKNRPERSLSGQYKADIAIVGGGVTGLSAAQAFLERGYSVVLLEKSFCGGGATGKSSAFIAPDSEYSLADFVHIYGVDDAQKLWRFAVDGVELIYRNIQEFSLVCQYIKQDTLVVATTKNYFKEHIEPEHEVRTKLGYESILYTPDELYRIVHAENYYGGVRYGGSFGIQGYEYCQGIKRALLDKYPTKFTLFEETPVLSVTDNALKTPEGIVHADYLVLCVDHALPELNLLVDNVYHAQTFLMLSPVLTDEQLSLLFGDPHVMIWDTELIYNYYRLTPDNRLMFGGSSLWYTYRGNTCPRGTIFNKFMRYWAHHFPHVSLEWEYIWSGLIGISKDIMPLAGFDRNNNHVYYAIAPSGVPWGAALGQYSAQVITKERNDLDLFFSPYRDFSVGPVLQKVLGKPLSFAIANSLRLGSL